LPHKNPVCITPLPHTCHMTRPCHSFWYDHPNKLQICASYSTGWCLYQRRHAYSAANIRLRAQGHSKVELQKGKCWNALNKQDLIISEGGQIHLSPTVRIVINRPIYERVIATCILLDHWNINFRTTEIVLLEEKTHACWNNIDNRLPCNIVHIITTCILCSLKLRFSKTPYRTSPIFIDL
jgi:hypothetical protein